MAKVDLKHAYRSIPIHPAELSGYWLKMAILRRCAFHLLFTILASHSGQKGSPEIFHPLTQSVRRMMAKRGFPNIVVYLDDFLIIGASTRTVSTRLQYPPETPYGLGLHHKRAQTCGPNSALDISEHPVGHNGLYDDLAGGAFKPLLLNFTPSG